jgi:hypothetical protein
MRPLRLASALSSCALIAACGHTRPIAPSQPSVATSRPAAPSPAGAPREGEVAVEFLADPDSPKPKLDESQEFTPASPRSTPLPEYPPVALAGAAPPAVVAVRIMIDEWGHVYEVKDSPRLVPTRGPFAAEFREAVEAAVKRWMFTAARIDTLGPPHPDMPQRPLMAYRRVPTFLDFAFRFSVVDGRGVVSLGGETPVAAPSTPPERVK